jgi:hypothetical protein
MMLRDRFDQLMIVALVGVLIFAAVLMAGAGPRYDTQDDQAAKRRFEREMLVLY